MSEIKKLSLTQIDEGRKKVLINADRLVQDAKILLKNNGWARAFFLSQLSMEELGKYITLISTALNPDYEKIDWGKFWKMYRIHKSETRNIPLLEFLFPEMKTLKDLKVRLKRFQEVGENMLETLRVVSLYSDFHRNSFYGPMEVITNELATFWMSIAERYLDYIKSFDKKIIGVEGLLNLRKRGVR